MHPAIAYTILGARGIDLNKVGITIGKTDDPFYGAINCLVGMPGKYKLVMDYVYGYEIEAADKIIKLIDIDCDQKDMVTVLSLLELQKNQKFSERECAAFLNVSRNSCRKKYRNCHHDVYTELCRWLDAGIYHAKSR